MNNSNNTILVTGGAGYIGSHAYKALSKAGYFPVSFDNLSRGHKWAVKWGPLEVGDILDEDRLNEVIEGYKPVAVMHFAALSYVGESVTNPMLYYKNNVIGTYTLLRTMTNHSINKFIFSSTCAIYGHPVYQPINETHILSAINPYGNTKVTIEKLLSDLSINNQIKYVSLRYFNAAGADVDGEIGELHTPETHLIPLVLDVACGKQEYIEIFGDDYDSPDGTCIRDYIHVTDLADAHIKALKHLLEGGNSTFYNLGSESGYSVKDIIFHAKIITGNNITIKIAPRRIGDPVSLIADSSKIKNELKWSAEMSDLNSIISTAWNWQTR